MRTAPRAATPPAMPRHRVPSRTVPRRAPRGRPRWATAAWATAAGLGIAALLNGVRTRMAERMHPPRGRAITVDGVRLSYVETGSDKGLPPAVFIHGIGSMGADFLLSGLPDLAGRDRRTLTFDRPGYGYSERPRGAHWSARAQARLIWRALDRLGAGQPVLVGHSFGTLVCLEMAALRPGAAAGLVLVSGYYVPTPRPEPYVMGIGALPVVGDLLRHTIDPPLMHLAAPALTKSMFSPKPVPDYYREHWPAELLERPSQLRAFSEDWLTLVGSAASIAKRYRSLALPVVLIHGTQDRVAPAAVHPVRLVDELPDAELELIEGEGHMPHHGARMRVLAAIDRVTRAGRLRTTRDSLAGAR